MQTHINPFEGATRFYCKAPSYPQAHLEMPESYGRMWKNDPNEYYDCVCVTTGDGEVSQLGIDRWNGKIFLSKGLPELLCEHGIEPNDLMIFSFDNFTDLRVAMFKVLGDEFIVNQGVNNLYPPSGTQAQTANPPGSSHETPPDVATAGRAICPKPVVRVPVCRSARIILDYNAANAPYILDIPMEFAENNLPKGVSEVQLNVEGVSGGKIMCVVGPKRAIATVGWSNFVNKAKLKAGHIFSFYKNPAYTDMWNVSLTRTASNN